MKKKLFKLIAVLLIVVTLSSIFMPPVYAGVVEDILSSVIALFTYPVRRLAIAIGAGVDSLIADVAYIDGKTAGNEFTSQSSITPFDILYNKVLILDINFFDVNAVSPVRNPLAYQVRLGLASWFYILRIVAVVVLFVILIYVGIRMALSTVASERTKYKKMITDWVVSLILVFLVQYIMIFTITINNALVSGLSVVVQSGKIQGVYESIKNTAMEWTNPNSNAAAVVYVMLVFQTFGLLCSYFNRMLKCAFLTIISPLITITYSIDRMGDGKAQAFGAWTKEYVYTVLIQPFHCMIYMVFVNTAFDLLENVKPGSNIETIAIAIIAIICLRFVKDAENILRQIFQFKNDASDSSLQNALTMGVSAYAVTKNAGTNVKNTLHGAKELKTSVTTGLAAAELNKAALRRYKSENKGKSEDEKISYEEAREEARADLDEKAAEKIESKLGTKIDQGEIDRRVEEIKKKSGLKDPKDDAEKAKLDRRLQARAKRDIAEKHKMHHKERSATGRISGFAREVRGVYNNSSVLKGATKVARGYISAGVGMAAMGGLASTSDPAAIVAGAIAATKTTSDFLSSSVGTAAHNAESIASAAGVTNKLEMAEYAAQAFAECGDEVAEQTNAEEIMTDIQNALISAGLGGSGTKGDVKKIAKSIRNNIKRAVPAAKSPEDMARIQEHAIAQALRQHGVVEQGTNKPLESVAGNAELLSAVASMGSHENKAAFVRSVNNGAQATGISADTMVGTIIGRQSGRLSSDDSVVKISAVGGSASGYEDADDYRAKTAGYDTVADGYNDETLEALDQRDRTSRRKKVDRIDEQIAENEAEIARLEKQIEDDTKQITELQEDETPGLDHTEVIAEMEKSVDEARDAIDELRKSDSRLQEQREKLLEDASKIISDKQFELLGRQMAEIDANAGEARKRLFDLYHRKAESICQELEAKIAHMSKSIGNMETALSEGVVSDEYHRLDLEASIDAMRTTMGIEEARLERHRQTLGIFEQNEPMVNGTIDE